jgi:hypothetical protein
LNNHVPNGLWSKHCAFTKRYNQQIKGDMLVIGNNFWKKQSPLNDNSVNENTVMQFIDIDTDTNTFSSSSATIVPPATTCFRIAYAGCIGEL